MFGGAGELLRAARTASRGAFHAIKAVVRTEADQRTVSLLRWRSKGQNKEAYGRTWSSLTRAEWSQILITP